jgi:hypothetical protein
MVEAKPSDAIEQVSLLALVYWLSPIEKVRLPMIRFGSI